MDQYSDEWWQARAGKVTASRMADVTARTKSGWGAGRANYLAELVAERLTGVTAASYTNAAMQWGVDTEPDARIAYEFYRDAEVEEVGFIDHPEIAMSGASPDGLVGDEGMVEIKCPNTAIHIDTLLGTPIADKYIKQMHWQMACAGRQWCDFVSFDPRLPEQLKLYVARIERDDKLTESLEADVRTFLAELDDKVARLQKLQEVA